MSTGRYTASERPQPDAVAPAAIRPGMPGDALRAAFGPAWREPAPHKGGVVDIAQNTLGVVARLTAGDEVGEIAVDWRFPETGAILGLTIGMSVADAKATRPDIDVGAPLKFMEHMRIGQAQDDGFLIDVAFHTETLHDIRLRNPDARYTEPGPPVYPLSNGPVGAPFADTNFKLVVLSNLLESKTIDLGTPAEFFAHVLGRPYDADRDGFGEIAAARTYLDRFELTPELLAAVECLHFDGGIDAYTFLENSHLHDWEALEVTDLSGIELLVNVTQFLGTSGLSEVDLRTLVPLPKLRELSVGVACTHLEALLDMPSLESCRVMGNETYDEVTENGHPTREVMDALKARGVKVWVHWISHSGFGQPPAFE